MTADLNDNGLAELLDSKINCVTTDVLYKSTPLVYSDNRKAVFSPFNILWNWCIFELLILQDH